jgi:heme/copper-type cytochrome/quinol oxidase subunit 2
METALESQLLSILGTLALVLMVVVTGGIVYLTAADWRDRRRRKRDQESTKVRSNTKARSKRSKK